MMEAGEHEALAAELIAEHYDPRYARGAMRRDASPALEVVLHGPDEAAVEAAAVRVRDAMG